MEKFTARILCWSVCKQQYLIASVRSLSSWKGKILHREDIKDTVHQYVGKHQKRAERVYVWGNAVTGALGMKKYLIPEGNAHPKLVRKKPVKLAFLDQQGYKAVNATCGYGFTVWVIKGPEGAHRLLGSGINTDSQLGVHEEPPKSGRLLDYIIQPLFIDLPTRSVGLTKVVDVSCGRAHTVIVTHDDGVFSLGNNAYGQCGRPIVDNEQFRGNPLVNKLNLEENISKVVCGCDHTMFLTDSGSVYSSGLGADGQTGQGHYDCVGYPVKLCGDLEGEHIVSVSGMADTVLAVSDKGQIFGWGNSEYNQLSSITDQTQVNVPRHLSLQDVGMVTKVAAGGTICALLNNCGQVYVWGFGLLGKGPALENTAIPSLIPPTLFGRNEFNPDSTVVDIQCGINYFMALTDKGELYAWGKNKSGNLGLGHEKDIFFPLKVSVPAEVTKVVCGIDHTVTLAKAFA